MSTGLPELIRSQWRRTAGRSPVVRVFVLLTNTVQAVLYRSGVMFLARPINALLVPVRRAKVEAGTVLHLSYMVHIPYYTSRILRKEGVKADYLAVGAPSANWNRFDHHFDPRPRSVIRELAFFWRVVARYQVIHCHFGMGLTSAGWEFPVLRRLGCKIVVHYRGCEVRDEAKNKALHPVMNICQECDYGGTVCREGRPRVARITPYADLALVTTPDLKDFVPEAIHFPFFAPDPEELRLQATPASPDQARRTFKIVHATNHPGIEGTRYIVAAVENLKARGHAIELIYLHGVSPERVIEAHRDADLSIGKMKMGYYANSQIESLFLGVPAITWIRPEFVTPEITRSGLILCHLDDLEKTLEHYLAHPEELAEKRRIARASALALHDNQALARRLIGLYFGGT